MNSKTLEFERPDSLMVVDKPPRPVAQAKYIQKVWQVLDLIAQGYSVSRACRTVKLSNETLYATKKRYPGIEAAYDSAQRQACDALVDALLDINDHPIYGKGDAQDKKLMSDNIKWVLARKDRARFGTQTQHDAQANAQKAEHITSALQRAKKVGLIE